jgi:hypothetical protein
MKRALIVAGILLFAEAGGGEGVLTGSLVESTRNGVAVGKQRSPDPVQFKFTTQLKGPVAVRICPWDLAPARIARKRLAHHIDAGLTGLEVTCSTQDCRIDIPRDTQIRTGYYVVCHGNPGDPETFKAVTEPFKVATDRYEDPLIHKQAHASLGNQGTHAPETLANDAVVQVKVTNRDDPSELLASGLGAVISESLLIATAAHVVAVAKRSTIKVTFRPGATVQRGGSASNVAEEIEYVDFNVKLGRAPMHFPPGHDSMDQLTILVPLKPSAAPLPNNYFAVMHPSPTGEFSFDPANRTSYLGRKEKTPPYKVAGVETQRKSPISLGADGFTKKFEQCLFYDALEHGASGTPLFDDSRQLWAIYTMKTADGGGQAHWAADIVKVLNQLTESGEFDLFHKDTDPKVLETTNTH